MKVIACCCLILFIAFAKAQEQGDIGASNPEDASVVEQTYSPDPPPTTEAVTTRVTHRPSRKPGVRRTTRIANDEPASEATTVAASTTAEIPDQCKNRVDIILPGLSQCTKCSSDLDCNAEKFVCCSVLVIGIPLFAPAGGQRQTCCVIRKPASSSTTTTVTP